MAIDTQENGHQQGRVFFRPGVMKGIGWVVNGQVPLQNVQTIQRFRLEDLVKLGIVMHQRGKVGLPRKWIEPFLTRVSVLFSAISCWTRVSWISCANTLIINSGLPWPSLTFRSAFPSTDAVKLVPSTLALTHWRKTSSSCFLFTFFRARPMVVALGGVAR